MFKYWLKNRCLFDIFSGLLAAVVFCFGFIYPSFNEKGSIQRENEIYLKTTIDYQIPNPSVSQLVGVEQKDFIDQTFGYYLTKVNVGEKKTTLLISDQMDNVDFTMFGANCVVSKGPLVNNGAYIDEKTSSITGLGIGDILSISISGTPFSFTVNAITRHNSLFDDGTVLVGMSESLKTVYSSNASINSYSGAFLKANNTIECEAFLKTYIPFGRLKDRSEFDSDEAFNIYNDAILSGNYQNEISNFHERRSLANEKVAQANSKVSLFSYLGLMVVAIFIIIINLVLRFRRSEKLYFGEVLKSKQSVVQYRILSTAGEVICFAIVYFLLAFIMKFMASSILPFLISLTFVLLCGLLNILLDRRYLKTRKKK